MKRFVDDADDEPGDGDAKRLITAVEPSGGAADHTEGKIRPWNLDDCLSGEDRTSLKELRFYAYDLGAPTTVASTREALCHEIAARQQWPENHVDKLEELGLESGKKRSLVALLEEYLSSDDDEQLLTGLHTMSDHKSTTKERSLLVDALVRAIQNEHVQLIESLLPIAATYKLKNTPLLEYVLARKEWTLAAMMIEHGATVREKFKTRLRFGGLGDDVSTLTTKLFQLLKDWDVHRDHESILKTKGNGYSEQAKKTVLKKFLEWEADVNARNQEFKFPLQVFVENDEGVHQDVVQILIDAGTDVQKIPSLLWIAAGKAEKTGNFDIVRTLIKNGANVNFVLKAEGRKSQTVLLHLLQSGSAPDDVIEMLAKREHVEQIDRNGFPTYDELLGKDVPYIQVLLPVAAQANKLELVIRHAKPTLDDIVNSISLLATLPDEMGKFIPYLNNRYGEALLLYLSSVHFQELQAQDKLRDQSEKLIHWYLNLNVAPDLRTVVDQNGNSLLMLYVMNSTVMDDNIIEKLMVKTDINGTNNAGVTALDWAQLHGKKDAIEILLSYGAKVTYHDIGVVPKSFDDTYPTLWTDFKKVKQLGRGANGIVYEVVHRKSGRHYALKVMTTANWIDKSTQEVRQRLDGELRGIEQLSESPHCSLRVACLYGYFQINNANKRTEYALLMDLVYGTSLGNVSLQDVNTDAVIGWIRGLLLALAEIHEKGVAHRDLHPENIIVTQQPTDLAEWKNVSETMKAPIVIIDLGSACVKNVGDALLPYSCSSQRGNRTYWSSKLAALVEAGYKLDFRTWERNDLYAAGLSVLQTVLADSSYLLRQLLKQPDFLENLDIQSPYIKEFFRQTLLPGAEPMTARALLQHLDTFAPSCPVVDPSDELLLMATPRSIQKTAATQQKLQFEELDFSEQREIEAVISSFTHDSTPYRTFLQNKYFRPGHVMGAPETFQITENPRRIERLETLALVNEASSHAVTLYRGMYNEKVAIGVRSSKLKVNWFSRRFNVDTASRFEPGQILAFGTILSTTYEPQKAINFMKVTAPLGTKGCFACCLLRFEVPHGYPRIDVAAWSSIPKEREVVLPAHVLTEQGIQHKQNGQLNYATLLQQFDTWTTLAQYVVKSVKDTKIAYHAHTDNLRGVSLHNTELHERLIKLGLSDEKTVAPLRRMNVKLITLVPINGV